tara:strand:- start:1328 stop:2407 length:1080 start_codon:yes stop_codon:yes gene_type:complete
MKNNSSNFITDKDKLTPVDEFLEKVLYDPKIGYYSKKIPFGRKGDFITSPTISNLFSEIIGIWIVSTWEKLGKPNKFNFVELGPGDGSLTKILVNTFKKFPKFNNATKIYLYEKSKLLKNVQKNKIKSSKVEWINDFKSINEGPVIFFGNEFFDAIPIKQFSYINKSLFEKFYLFNNSYKINEIYRKASTEDISQIKSYKVLKGLKFIEYPKLGFLELNKIVKKISKLSGGILLIDYGYLNHLNISTLQTVMENKKIPLNSIFNNLGKADITYLVNFNLLKEYFIKNNLKVKKIVNQKFFLEKMGIIERANILKKKMTTKEEKYVSSTLTRLLHKKMMGDLFKVIFAFKSNKNNFLGFK